MQAYTADWRRLDEWCRAGGLASLPASAATLAAYVDERADTLRVASVQRRVATVRARHVDRGMASPTRIRSCEQRSPVPSGAAATTARTTAPAGRRRPPRRVAGAAPNTAAAARDRALVLLGYGAGLAPGGACRPAGRRRTRRGRRDRGLDAARAGGRPVRLRRMAVLSPPRGGHVARRRPGLEPDQRSPWTGTARCARARLGVRGDAHRAAPADRHTVWSRHALQDARCGGGWCPQPPNTARTRARMMAQTDIEAAGADPALHGGDRRQVPQWHTSPTTLSHETVHAARRHRGRDISAGADQCLLQCGRDPGTTNRRARPLTAPRWPGPLDDRREN